MIKSLDILATEEGVGAGFYDANDELVEKLEAEDTGMALGMFVAAIRGFVCEMERITDGMVTNEILHMCAEMAFDHPLDKSKYAGVRNC